MVKIVPQEEQAYIALYILSCQIQQVAQVCVFAYMYICIHIHLRYTHAQHTHTLTHTHTNTQASTPAYINLHVNATIRPVHRTLINLSVGCRASPARICTSCQCSPLFLPHALMLLLTFSGILNFVTVHTNMLIPLDYTSKHAIMLVKSLVISVSWPSI